MNKFISIIRTFLVFISFVVFGIGTIIMGYIVFPLNKRMYKSPEKLHKAYLNLINKSWYFFVRALCFIRLIRLEIDDINKLRNIKNSIIVSTHPSFIDGVILMALIPDTTCFVAERLAKNKITKNIVNSICLVSHRPLEELKTNTKKMTDEGFNILIFPTGIRHRKNEYPKIRKGASLIAMNCKKNIVPIVMYTDFDFLYINQPVYKAGSKPVTYSIFTKDSIDVEKIMQTYPDSVDCKRELTKLISMELYDGFAEKSKNAGKKSCAAPAYSGKGAANPDTPRRLSTPVSADKL
ncbi:MAG: 1-acyl-sn-glycerol-3-phosphate acyltransferase [Candidatus Gastranaerophilales bacterium]|nr:1-acyl-sn-glycerol-3-phosphate acyltransferase [Candidatus Gastranaerophilales bacterium]